MWLQRYCPCTRFQSTSRADTNVFGTHICQNLIHSSSILSVITMSSYGGVGRRGQVVSASAVVSERRTYRLSPRLLTLATWCAAVRTLVDSDLLVIRSLGTSQCGSAQLRPGFERLLEDCLCTPSITNRPHFSVASELSIKLSRSDTHILLAVLGALLRLAVRSRYHAHY